MLPCSHSFCQSCLEHLEKDDNKNCSYCRKFWGNSKVCDLICCLQLLPESGSEITNKSATQKCPEHDTEITMWCESCSKSICIKCLSLKHKKCNWILLEEQKENLTAVYEIAVSHLVEMASKSGVVIDSLDRFEREIQNFRDILRSWQIEVEQELAEHPMPQAEAGTKRDEREGQEILNALVAKQLELSDKASSFLSYLEDNSQTSDISSSQSLRAQLECLTETTLLTEVCSANNGSKTNNKAACVRKNRDLVKTNPNAQTTNMQMQETASNDPSFFGSGSSVGNLVPGDPLVFPHPLSTDGSLVIRDTSAFSNVSSILQSSTSASPKFVNIVGSNWKEPEFSNDLLNVISSNCCGVSLKTLDAFLQPSARVSSTKTSGKFTFSKSISDDEKRFSRKPLSRSLHATSVRLRTLLKPGFRCVLTEFWGHLDPGSLHKLPKTLRTLGLALADREDLTTLRLVLDMDGEKWALKEDWYHLAKIHLSFSRSLKAKDLKNDKTVKELVGDQSMSQHREADLGLHFYKVDSANLGWMRDITQCCAKKGSVSEVFLPAAWFTPYLGRASFKDDFMKQVLVHLPLDLKLAGASKTLGVCPIQWDL